jgi:hypothetical protein
MELERERERGRRERVERDRRERESRESAERERKSGAMLILHSKKMKTVINFLFILQV